MDARRFPNRSTSVRLARRFVADQLSDLAPDLVEVVTLMVSELATNCIRHADADFTVRVQFETDRVRVVVADDGPGSPQLRSPTPSEPYGRGLQIVSEFSDEWGFDVSPESGTSVWFSVHVHGRRESAAASDRIETRAGDRARRARATPPVNPSIRGSTGSGTRSTISPVGPVDERSNGVARPGVSAPATSPGDAGRPPSWSGSDNRSSNTGGWRSWTCRRTPCRTPRRCRSRGGARTRRRSSSRGPRRRSMSTSGRGRRRGGDGEDAIGRSRWRGGGSPGGSRATC
jgi:anti-sigma regulatory factor (Ser/Thr protein kinase)